jgi:hypothetical protein
MVNVSLARNLCGESLKNVVDNGTVTTPKKSLEDRITALEERVMRLESGEMSIDLDDDSSSLFHVDLYGDLWSTEQPPNPQPERVTKMGAPKKMSDEDFAQRRDNYVNWIESFWPEVEQLTSSPENEADFRKKLLQRFPSREGDWIFQMLIANIAGLLAYLSSRRNTGEPRRMAYVLAGLSGGLTWKYSVERGIKNPSLEHIGFRAMREHIQRHHPAWHRDLTSKPTQAKAIKKIPPRCQECVRFRSRPEKIIPALQVRPYPS